MSNNHIKVKNEFGELSAVFATTAREYSDIMYAIDLTTDFDEDVLNDLLMFIEEKRLKVGMLTNVRVEDEHRGNGHGASFLQVYKDKVMPRTQIDIVFARVSNPQAEGFSLLKFYGKLGFDIVYLSDGDMLMANKGYAPQLRELLSRLREQRVSGYLNKNSNTDNESSLSI